jgi:3'-phosphoadenosine 5'-phosphosulfate sulfotransferase (PAPS reductase)/FAD synthetase
MNKLYHIGISGGKDSTALLLWMVYESGIPRDQMQATFCDTRNEARETYDHIAMLSAKVFPIQWLETEGFENLVIKHKIFPNNHRRYCTKELKLIPTKRHLENLSEEFGEVIPCSGVRRDESFDRKDLPEWGNPLESYFGLREWRPLINWKIEDVLTIHAKYKIPLNPLYGLGAKRVGCFPCINSSKSELRALIQHHPDRIDQIRNLEARMKEMSGQTQSFFASNKVPLRFRSATYISAEGKPVKVCTIDDVVAWAKTGWKARGNAPDIDGLFQDQLKHLEPRLCLAHYTACE